MKYYIDVKITGRQYLDEEDMQMLNSLSFQEQQEFLEKVRKEVDMHMIFADLSNRKIYLEYGGEKE